MRIRLHSFKTDDGETRYMVEISAWNAWAGQGKILDAIGGIQLELAEKIFDASAEFIRGFDWTENDFIRSPESA